MKQIVLVVVIGLVAVVARWTVSTSEIPAEFDDDAIARAGWSREALVERTSNDVSASQFVPEASRSAAPEFDVRADASTVGKRVTIQVRDSRGGPVAGAVVESLEVSNNQSAAFVVTQRWGSDARGQVDSDPLVRSRTWLRAAHADHGSTMVALLGTPIDEPIEIRLPDDVGFTLRGRIVYTSGLPATDILLCSLEAGPLANEDLEPRFATVDASGSFSIEGLRSGNHRIILEKHPARSVLCERSVEIHGCDAELDLVLVESGTIRGVIRDSGGTTIQAEITACEIPSNPPFTAIHTTRSRSRSGKYEFPALLPAEYLVRVKAPRCEPYEQTIRLDAGANLELNITLNRGGSIRGIISSKSGVVGRATVRAFRQLDNRWQRAGEVASDAHGAFEFSSLALGRYRLDIDSDLHAYSTIRDLELNDVRPTLEVQHTLEDGTRIQGNVGGWSEIASTTTAAIKVESDRFGLRVLPVEIDEAGSFIVDRLPAGFCRTELRIPDRDPIRVELWLTGLAPALCEYRMNPMSVNHSSSRH